MPLYTIRIIYTSQNSKRQVVARDRSISFNVDAQTIDAARDYANTFFVSDRPVTPGEKFIVPIIAVALKNV